MSNKYKLTISLNVLNHLGVYLYSNTPTVLAEVIANAWDADATRVAVDFDLSRGTIAVTDDGHGMDLDDINSKYLHVGYERRAGGVFRTPSGRLPMGRKGIGKLSLFSITKQFAVFSRKQDGAGQAFLMDADEITKAIECGDPSKPADYHPKEIPFNADLGPHGTSIRIHQLKKVRLTRQSIAALRKRIARRFGVIGDGYNFHILINNEAVTFADRDYFHKARFLFQYGSYDYAQHCANLDTDTGAKLSFPRECRFDASGNACADGEHAVRGWIGIARRSNDLDDQGEQDNLNKITVVVRGKVALEDILQEYRLGGMITKFIYGEINADFLDEDGQDDIATSSRQSIVVDDPRFAALRAFIGRELRHIWLETNNLKEKKGLEQALLSNPLISKWYDALQPRSLQASAAKVFGAIDKANVDEAHKQDFYANGILAFEKLKMGHALDGLNRIDAQNLDVFMEYLADVDALEAASYLEIVRERLAVIQKLQVKVAENVLERVLQEYVFDHLWLFDPSWERATGEQTMHMEERLQAVVNGATTDKTVRLDIRYRRISGAHVIIELKRASRSLRKTDIESQAVRYIEALEKELAKTPDQAQFPIEAVCLVGKLPQGWHDPKRRRTDEQALDLYHVRVMTYDELIDSASRAYSRFIAASQGVDKLRQLIDEIRSYRPG